MPASYHDITGGDVRMPEGAGEELEAQVALWGDICDILTCSDPHKLEAHRARARYLQLS